MASIKSLPFSIETKSETLNRLRSPFFSIRRRMTAGDLSVISASGYSKAVVGLCSSCRTGWRVKALRAMRKVDDESEEEDSGELHQIAERKKLVSSIVSGHTEEREEDGSLEQLESSTGVGSNRANYDVESTTTSAASEWSDSVPSFISTTVEPSFVKDEEKLQEVNAGAADPTIVDQKPPPLAGPNFMNIILAAAECAPWSKTGGLGDVAGALPKALARRGHRVMVVAPRYGNYAEPQDLGVRKGYKVDGQHMEVAFFHSYIDGVDFVFIDSPIFRDMENNIYGGKRYLEADGVILQGCC